MSQCDYTYNFKQTSFRDFSAVYNTILWIYTIVFTKTYCVLCGEYYGVFFAKNFKELVKRKTYTFVWFCFSFYKNIVTFTVSITYLQRLHLGY